MAIRTRFQRFLRGSVVPLAAIACTSYFAYHAFHGSHGIFAGLRLERQIDTLETELDLVRLQREALEKRVALMRPESLDPDLLDERARDMLNFVHPNDLVIPRQSAQ